MKMNEWRTWSGEIILGVFMLIALGICRGAADGAAKLTTVVTGLGGLGLWLAGKSGWQHASGAKAAATAKEPAASILATGAAAGS